MKNRFIEHTLEFSSLLVMLLNFSSGLVSIVWLLFLGQWKLLVIGFIIGIIMPLVYTVLALPSMGLMSVTIKLIEKKNKIGIIVALLGSIYEKILLFIWLVYVFNLF